MVCDTHYEVRTFNIGIHTVKVSAEDFDRVSAYSWYIWGSYPTSPKIGKLHEFIIGSRPANLPDDWIIDHANRDKMDATRENLRYVSRAFNNWNSVKPSSAKYRGVTFCRRTCKWRARFLQKNLGYFDKEYDAGYAYAKAVIEKWQWAQGSDILFGDDKLPLSDMIRIKTDLAKDERFDKSCRKTLPKGIHRRRNSSLYRARIGSIEVGYFKTAEEAVIALEAKRAAIQSEHWNKHLEAVIPRDDNGNCQIALTGKRGSGKFALVPEDLWHQLTFRKPWALGSHGYPVTGRGICLHAMIFELIHPGYDKSLSIDHITPHDKLDNRESNLRLATRSEQAFNKSKRKNCASQYIGVTKAGKNWRASLNKDKKKYYLGVFKTEEEAWAARQEKAAELYG